MRETTKSFLVLRICGRGVSNAENCPGFWQPYVRSGVGFGGAEERAAIQWEMSTGLRKKRWWFFFKFSSIALIFLLYKKNQNNDIFSILLQIYFYCFFTFNFLSSVLFRIFFVYLVVTPKIWNLRDAGYNSGFLKLRSFQTSKIICEDERECENVVTFCQTKTLWTIAQPQKIMPNPIKTLVTMAGVEWNWMKVYRIIPARHKQSKTCQQ